MLEGLNQLAHTLGEVDLVTLLRRFGVAPTSQGLTEDEKIAVIAGLVLIIVPLAFGLSGVSQLIQPFWP